MILNYRMRGHRSPVRANKIRHYADERPVGGRWLYEIYRTIDGLWA